MIEFKQIIGRGTRLFDGKDYFTIYDFVKAYEHFNDPAWDGEPMEPAEPPLVKRPPGVTDGDDPEPYDPEDRPERPKTIVIKLADGKERTIRHISATSFWGPDGKPMSAAQFIESLFGQLPQLFRDDELRKIWSQPGTRRALLNALAERGFGGEQLAAMSKVIDAENSDVFDVLAYIAFTLAPISRADRVAHHRASILSRYDAKLQAFIDFVLAQYVIQGIDELDQDKLVRLLELKYRTLHDAQSELGSVPKIRDAFVGFQQELFATPN